MTAPHIVEVSQEVCSGCQGMIAMPRPIRIVVGEDYVRCTFCYVATFLGSGLAVGGVSGNRGLVFWGNYGIWGNTRPLPPED